MMVEQGEHRTIVMPRQRTGTRDDLSIVAPALRVGTRIGRYRLCLELASGGMSTVYLARMQGGVGVHSFVALKVLKPQLAADPTFVEMFLDEARLASLIHHPNVCDVVDYRIQDGVSYLAMEHLSGQSLSAVRRQLLVDDAMPVGQYVGIVARIIADAAEGLHAAHELTDARGEPLAVVHRDVSPENVFITYDGCVKIMDFGIAATAQQRHRTQPGTVKGKYAYIAPEVLKGQKPTRRADVWSLGVVAWEMLAGGRRLFDGENDVDILRAVSEAEIPAPSSVRPGIPAELDEIVLRALQRDPAVRYPTTRELGRKLIYLLAEQRLAVGLAELAEFMDRLFRNGRACARQLLDTVERMDGATVVNDHDEPTVTRTATGEEESVAIPIVVDRERSVRTRPSTQDPRTREGERSVRTRPATVTGKVHAQVTPTAPTHALTSTRRLVWTIAPPVGALLILAAGALRGCPVTTTPSAAAKTAEVVEPAPPRSAAPAVTPVADPAACKPGDTVQLQAVSLPSGEVVYRVQPH